jgi:hypothetical protein
LSHLLGGGVRKYRGSGLLGWGLKVDFLPVMQGAIDFSSGTMGLSRAIGVGFCLLFCAAGAFGQKPKAEPSLEERLLRPEVKENHALQARSFQAPSSLQAKGFQEDRKFATEKSEQSGDKFEAPTFLGLKVPWLAKKKMETEAFAGKEQAFATQSANLVKDAERKEKGFAGASREALPVRRAVSVETASVPGTAQRQIDEIYQRGEGPLSVDEVRELLNKPR